MDFLIYQSEQGGRAQNKVVLSGAWNEKIVRDYVTDNLRDLQQTETCICPAELAPKRVRKCQAQPWRHYSARTYSEERLYDICSEISEKENEAFAAPLEYLEKEPIAAILFLKGALEKNKEKQEYLAGVISARYCPIKPGPLIDRTTGEYELPPVKEPGKTLENLEEELASAESLGERIKSEIDRLEAEPKHEEAIPMEFWRYLDAPQDENADDGTLEPAENIAPQDDNDGPANSVPALADGDGAQPPVEEQKSEPDWRSYPNSTSIQVTRRRVAMSEWEWEPLRISQWERNKENGLKLNKGNWIICNDRDVSTEPDAIRKCIKNATKEKE